MVIRKKQQEFKCPLCDGRVSNKKGLKLNNGIVFKGHGIVCKDSESGRYFIRLDTNEIMEVEEVE